MLLCIDPEFCVKCFGCISEIKCCAEFYLVRENCVNSFKKWTLYIWFSIWFGLQSPSAAFSRSQTDSSEAGEPPDFEQTAPGFSVSGVQIQISSFPVVRLRNSLYIQLYWSVLRRVEVYWAARTIKPQNCQDSPVQAVPYYTVRSLWGQRAGGGAGYEWVRMRDEENERELWGRVYGHSAGSKGEGK